MPGQGRRVTTLGNALASLKANVMSSKKISLNRLTVHWWSAFVIIVFAYMLAPFQRMAPTIMGPELTRDLGLNAVDFGFLGLIHMWAYALAQTPMGVMLDRFGARRGLTFILVVTAVGCGIFSASQTFALAAVGRAVVGISVAGFLIAGAKIIAAWNSSRDYPTVWGAFMGLGTLGGVLATAPLYFLMTNYGWRNSFLIIGGASLIIGIAAYFFVKDRPDDVQLAKIPSTQTAPNLTPEQTQANWSARFFGIIQSPRFILTGLFLIGISSSGQVLMALWGGIYLQDVYGFSNSAISEILTIGAVFMTFGGIAAGWSCRRIGSTNVMLSGAGAFLAAWAYMTVHIASMTEIELKAVIGIIGFTLTYCVTSCYAYVKEQAAASELGATMGAVNGVAWLFGAGTFQQIWGYIIHYMSHGVKPYPAEAFQAGMWLQTATLTVSVLCAILLKTQYEANLKREVRVGRYAQED